MVSSVTFRHAEGLRKRKQPEAQMESQTELNIHGSPYGSLFLPIPSFPFCWFLPFCICQSRPPCLLVPFLSSFATSHLRTVCSTLISPDFFISHFANAFHLTSSPPSVSFLLRFVLTIATLAVPNMSDGLFLGQYYFLRTFCAKVFIPLESTLLGFYAVNQHKVLHNSKLFSPPTYFGTTFYSKSCNFYIF